MWSLSSFCHASVSVLDNNVSSNTKNQHHHQDVQLDIGTQEVAVGEWYDKAQRLPQAKVGECCWRLVREQTPVQRCND